ncbi:leucine-rich repeat protein [Butyricimonas sp. An62]|uniref:leucine-rich repeat protein n=2 Tax=Odoribacteraceae TaxID=1853231 RepID=UPI002354B462|nr:leucine-rich repeat protein [Butyricimonas sp. An62]
MKRIWVALLLAGMAFGMGSCTKEDIDDIRKELQEHDDRLTSLEEWQKSVNTSISSLQSLIEALENKDYVTGVTPLADGSGYEISFLKSGKITIKHGEKGEKGEAGNTPVISVEQDTDGKYYWTVNDEWLLDDGNKMPVTGEKGDDGETPHIGDNGNWWIGSTDTGVKAQGNTGDDGLTPHIGDNGNWWVGTTDTGVKAQGEQGTPGTSAIAPQVRINTETNEWEISTDGGKTWTSTDVQATGDKGEQGEQGPVGPSGAACGISDIKIEGNNVIFTLGSGANEQQITIPLCSSVLTFNDLDEITENSKTFSTESELFSREDLVIQVRVESKNAYGTDILSRSASESWDIGTSVSSNKLEITVEPAKGTALNETAILKVSVTTEDGQQLAYGQKVFTNGIFAGVLSPTTEEEADEQLEKMGKKLNKDKATDIKVINWPEGLTIKYLINYINDEDYLIGTLEIAVPGIEKLPSKAFEKFKNIKVFKSEYCQLWGTNGATFEDSSVEEVYLPAVETLYQMEFDECANLRAVYLPNVETVEGSQVFNRCTSLETLDLPNLTTFNSPNYAYFAGRCPLLREVNMPKATSLPGSAFQECYSLTYLSFPNVEEMGSDIFWKCKNLVAISLPNVKALPKRAFAECVSLNAEEGFDVVEEVGESAFEECTMMKTATLKKVTKIGKNAFKNCRSLTLLGLGCVSEVDDTAFDGVDTKSCDLRFWGGKEPTGGDLDILNYKWCGKEWKSIMIFQSN